MTNQVSLNQIIADAQTNFRNLLEKTHNLIENYSKAYGEGDGRTVFFANYFQLNLWLLIQFDTFLEVLTPSSNRVNKHVSLAQQNIKPFMLRYDTINRASYCTKAIFDVEHFLKSIVKQLNMNPADGYWKLTKQLKNKLNLSGDQCNILNLPAFTRNSLHNNGYHTKDDFKVVIGIKTYKFEKGKKITFSGWGDLYIMFDELLYVIEHILQSADVRKEMKIPHTSETFS